MNQGIYADPGGYSLNDMQHDHGVRNITRGETALLSWEGADDSSNQTKG